MSKKIVIISVFLIVVAVASIFIWSLNRGKESTDDATLEAHAAPISARVGGYLVKLNVSDNQQVKKDEVVAEIDPSDYQLKVNAARANVDAAQAAATNAAVNAERQLSMTTTATSKKNVDDAVAAEGTAKAQLEFAKAQLAIAEKDLKDTKILAPEDGTVTMRTAEQGAYVAPGQPLFVLVGKKRWVVANFKEVQLTHMRPGQKVKIEVDAYPDVKLEGHVESIQMGTGARFSAFPPENATGNFVKIVQRVPVKIIIDTPLPADMEFGPGLSVRPVVFVGEATETSHNGGAQ